MRDLTAQEVKVVEAFSQFIISEGSAHTIATHLESIMWGYALYMLKDKELCGHPNNTEAIYLAKVLLEVLKTE